jgi:multidrug efflux pump subunit AcrB
MSATSNTFADPTTWNMIDGKQSVKLMRRQSGSNTVEIVDLVKGKLEEIKGSPDNC